MKLYQYDHCPFCVRADMVANYKEIAHDKVFLLNDDEETCYRLVNAKLVPILQFDNGEAMAESLDIAQLFDAQGNPERIIRPYRQHQQVSAGFDRVRMSISCLLFPRDIAIGLPEFATASARDYFRAKKEQLIGRSFEQALAETAQHRAAVEQALAELPALDLPSQHGNTLGWDDVIIYPTLRNLTMVAGLALPEALRGYLAEVTELTASHTYFDRAR